MAKKTPPRLIALSGSAVAAIYLAGYVATGGAGAAQAAAATPIVATVAAAKVATPAAALTTSAPATAGAYRDGTYAGAGTSRRGGFEVAVTVRAGRISDVAITRVTTQYPVSRVAALPAQVVARQSAQVDRVSGATYSVQAFQRAVQAALAPAQAA